MKAVILTVQPFAPPRCGLWCSACRLPSVIEVDLVISSERATVGTTTERRCMECGA